MSGMADLLDALAPHLREQRYASGDVLWLEGSRSGRLTLLVSGRVRITRTRPDGRTVLLYVFSPGDVFGFSPLVEDGPYPATATALDEVVARVCSRDELLRAVATEPRVSLLLLAELGKRLRQAFARIDELTANDARTRVAAAFCALLPPPEERPSPLVVSLPASSRALAEELGISPETLSRAISQMVTDGILHRLGRRRFQVLEPARLGALAAPIRW